MRLHCPHCPRCPRARPSPGCPRPRRLATVRKDSSRTRRGSRRPARKRQESLKCGNGASGTRSSAVLPENGIEGGYISEDWGGGEWALATQRRTSQRVRVSAQRSNNRSHGAALLTAWSRALGVVASEESSKSTGSVTWRRSPRSPRGPRPPRERERGSLKAARRIVIFVRPILGSIPRAS